MRVGEGACRQIIEDVLKEHNLNKKDFFGPTRLQYYVDARAEAICRMLQTKASDTTIAFVMQKNISTIQYYTMTPERRERRSKYYADRWQRLRAAAVARKEARASVSSKGKSCNASTAPAAQTS